MGAGACGAPGAVPPGFAAIQGGVIRPPPMGGVETGAFGGLACAAIGGLPEFVPAAPGWAFCLFSQGGVILAIWGPPIGIWPGAIGWPGVWPICWRLSRLSGGCGVMRSLCGDCITTYSTGRAFRYKSLHMTFLDMGNHGPCAGQKSLQAGIEGCKLKSLFRRKREFHGANFTRLLSAGSYQI